MLTRKVNRGLVLRHGLVHGFQVFISGAVGLEPTISIGFVRGKVLNKILLVKAQNRPYRTAPVVGPGAGVSGHGGVTQVLQIGDHTVGAVQVQPVEGGDPRHEKYRIAGEQLIFAGVGAAADVGHHRVPLQTVVQIPDGGKNLGVRLQVGDQVEVVEAFGQNQHNVRVFLFGDGGHGGGVVPGPGGGILGGGVGVVVRLDDGIDQQAHRFHGTAQIPVCIIGGLEGPSAGGGRLEGKGGKIPHIQDGKHPGSASPNPQGQAPKAERFPDPQLVLHKDQAEHQKIQPDDQKNPLGQMQFILSRHRCGGFDVGHILGHERRTVEFPGIVVGNRQDGKQGS